MSRNRNGNGMAATAFMAKKAEIDELLVRIARLSADHFGADPLKVNWGDVGTLDNHIRHLRRITDAAFKEGEHAG